MKRRQARKICKLARAGHLYRGSTIGRATRGQVMYGVRPIAAVVRATTVFGRHLHAATKAVVRLLALPAVQVLFEGASTSEAPACGSSDGT
jgi:hypothetical protein